jgi:hypothetical protein
VTDIRNSAVIEELKELLRSDDTQVGITFRLMEDGVQKASELISQGGGKNPGVISHNKAIINSVINGLHPKNSSYVSTKARRAIDRILENETKISDEVRSLLYRRKMELLEIINDKSAIQNDTKELVIESEKLEDKLKRLSNAIYVYTFPTYYRAGVDGDLDIKWLKIGKTTTNVWQRIIHQNRQTSMPEDPIIIRIYHAEGIDLDETERKMQETLKRVKHEQSSARYTKSGKEWFATTEDSIDAIAELLKLEIVRFEE